MGCILWNRTVIYTLPQSPRWCMQYRPIWDRVITALHCIILSLLCIIAPFKYVYGICEKYFNGIDTSPLAIKIFVRSFLTYPFSNNDHVEMSAIDKLSHGPTGLNETQNLTYGIWNTQSTTLSGVWIGRLQPNMIIIPKHPETWKWWQFIKRIIHDYLRLVNAREMSS